MKDSARSRQQDMEALDKQREARAKREEIKRNKKLEDATKDHITAMCYCEICHSPARWKTATEVNQQLNN